MDLVLVKEGFSWPGFFLPPLWALSRKLWLAALLIFAASTALSLVAYLAGVGAAGRGVIAFSFALLAGFIANDLWRWTLKRQGFVMEGIVAGRNKESAALRFLDHNPELAALLAAQA